MASPQVLKIKWARWLFPQLWYYLYTSSLMLLVVEVCVWRDVEVVGVGDVASVFFARMLHRAPNKALLSSLPDIHHPVPYPTSTLCSIPDPLCTLPVSQIHTTHKYPSVVEQMGDACQGARGGPAGERWTCGYRSGDSPMQRWRSRRDRFASVRARACAFCARLVFT